MSKIAYFPGHVEQQFFCEWAQERGLTLFIDRPTVGYINDRGDDRILYEALQLKQSPMRWTPLNNAEPLVAAPDISPHTRLADVPHFIFLRVWEETQPVSHHLCLVMPAKIQLDNKHYANFEGELKETSLQFNGMIKGKDLALDLQVSYADKFKIYPNPPDFSFVTTDFNDYSDHKIGITSARLGDVQGGLDINHVHNVGDVLIGYGLKAIEDLRQKASSSSKATY